MTEREETKKHGFCLNARSSGTLEGVTKVLSANPSMLCLLTDCGGLSILGKDLKISKFDDSLGKLVFSGEVVSLRYEGGKTPILKRIFR